MENLLEQYNPHWQRAFKYDLIDRPAYAEKFLPLIDRREILVVKGIRRSGKSSLLKLLINFLIKKKRVPGKNILFMNLEDYRFGSDKNLAVLDEIIKTFHEMNSPKGRIYILLDEIQEIPDFEKWLRTHYEQNEQMKCIITGSSSSLFSQELATLLTGRQVSMEVFPFSFAEMLQFKAPKKVLSELEKPVDMLYLSKAFEKLEPLLQSYLVGGGFPEMVKQDHAEGNILALQQYISDIILRDIAQRYNIRRIEVLKKLALYLIFNMSNGINVTQIAEQLGSNRTTILDLISYLEEVYMVFTTSSFSFAISEQMNTTKARKVYCIDNGFFAAIKTNEQTDFAKRMRNVVFQQLRFQWEETVFYWREKVEVDFVLQNGYPIGVATKDEDIDRKITQMFHYMQSHNLQRGVLINWKRLHILDENNASILMLPLWVFLTKSKDEILNYSE